MKFNTQPGTSREEEEDEKNLLSMLPLPSAVLRLEARDRCRVGRAMCAVGEYLVKISSQGKEIRR